MRKRRQLMVTVTMTPLSGMLRPGVVRESQVEAGKPRSRANAHSWRDAVATSLIVAETCNNALAIDIGGVAISASSFYRETERHIRA